nr:MAG TPA: hypothetical protein [Caudoviricetes sp.]
MRPPAWPLRRRALRVTQPSALGSTPSRPRRRPRYRSPLRRPPTRRRRPSPRLSSAEVRRRPTCRPTPPRPRCSRPTRLWGPASTP